MYTVDKVIEIIKEEKINVMMFYKTPGGSIKGAYICTLKGTELEVGNIFMSKYIIEEGRNANGIGQNGFCQKVCDYKITEKETEKVIYTQ